MSVTSSACFTGHFSSIPQFFDKVEGWMDLCMVKDHLTDIPHAEELLQQHNALKDTFLDLYGCARRDGHKIIQTLRKPVGESRCVAW